MKTNLIKTVVSLSLLLTGYMAYPTSGGDFVLNVSPTVKVSLTGTGDMIQWNTSGVPVTNLGVISAPKDITVTFPQEGSMELYSLTPTQGSFIVKNKPMKILFVAFDLTNAVPAGTPASVAKEFEAGRKAQPNAVSMVKAYRQYSDEAALGWKEITTVFFPKKISEKEPLKAVVMPDAKVKFEAGDVIDLTI
jgi:hypothetical protein